jgi:CBS domain-containing protein
MTTDVITAGGDMEIEDVAALMVDHGIKRVPVVEKGGHHRYYQPGRHHQNPG